MQGQYSFLDNKNLLGIWDEMYEKALGGVWATKIGLTVGSDLEIQPYAWLGAAPVLEELTDDAASEEQFGKYSYALKNKEYAKTIKFKESDLRRDKLGQIEIRLGEVADKAAEHWNILAAAGLLVATSAKGYDGVPFYSATHPEAAAVGFPNQINAVTATQCPALDAVSATAPTPYEMAQALNEIIGWFYTLVDDKGTPMNGQARKFRVICGTPQMFASANQAATLLTFAQGVQNPLIGLQLNGEKVQINVELVPQLNSLTTSIDVVREDGRVKPFILQSEVDVTPAVSDRQNDEFIKFRRFLFSIYASRAFGYMRWQSAIRATFS